MGKNLIQQARGKGSPTYKSPGFRFIGSLEMPKADVVQGVIKDLIKDPGHSTPIMQVESAEKTHLLPAPEGVKVGDVLNFGENAPITPGNILCLKDIPEGTLVHNIESRPGDGGKFCRSAGVFAKVVNRLDQGVVLMLPSKQEKTFMHQCRASIGIPAGGGAGEKPMLKAGVAYMKRHAKNKKYPSVSGNSQNAVDHPFGKSRSSKKGRPTIAPKNAPPGKKVGKLHPSHTGRVKR